MNYKEIEEFVLNIKGKKVIFNERFNSLLGGYFIPNGRFDTHDDQYYIYGNTQYIKQVGFDFPYIKDRINEGSWFIEENETKTEIETPHKCRCNSLDLLRKGCQCGGV